MAFIGKSPSTVFSAAAKKQSFTGDGSTTAFDLSYVVPAGGENSLQVFVDNVRQEPGSGKSFTLGLDGSSDLKRINFAVAPDSGADIYVIVPVEATNIKNVSDDSITNAKVSPSAAIADSKLAQITTSSKVATSAIVQPGSPGVYLDGAGSWSAIDTSQQDTNAFNIGLLGFKMAVNEGLTVFNLVDGVVDEFNDESGTDEAEGTNDRYVAASDYYINSNTDDGLSICTPYSAGFAVASITEPDTSTAGTNPAQNTGTFGSFTVPTGMTSLNAYLWGAGGGAGGSNPDNCDSTSGAGGFATGTLAVTPGQSFEIVVGEAGANGTHSGRPLGNGGAFESANTGTPSSSGVAGQGGGLSGVFSPSSFYAAPYTTCTSTTPAPDVFIVAGAGGGKGYLAPCYPMATIMAGHGGGLAGKQAITQTATTARHPNNTSGGGGDQEQGGQGGCGANDGGFLVGGKTGGDGNTGAGGSGLYGGGGSEFASPPGPTDFRGGGGGSSYIGHPQITCGSTEIGSPGPGPQVASVGGDDNPFYPSTPSNTGDGILKTTPGVGNDGYVLLTGCSSICATTQSTTIVSSAFTSTSVPTNARIVVFEENVDSPTLNTDIIASVSRDGTNFTNATLSDSGYVTGSSGQRILTGQADISGQPSGQSMRWKLALANNTVKIHGVSLQWD